MTSRLTYSLPPMYVLNSDSLYGSWMGAQPHSRRGGHNRTQRNEQPTFVSDVVPLPPPLSSPLLPHLTPAIVIFLTPRNVVVAVDGWEKAGGCERHTDWTSFEREQLENFKARARPESSSAISNCNLRLSSPSH